MVNHALFRHQKRGVCEGRQVWARGTQTTARKTRASPRRHVDVEACQRNEHRISEIGLSVPPSFTVWRRWTANTRRVAYRALARLVVDLASLRGRRRLSFPHVFDDWKNGSLYVVDDAARALRRSAPVHCGTQSVGRIACLIPTRVSTEDAASPLCFSDDL
jgi:hypothetical protein